MQTKWHLCPSRGTSRPSAWKSQFRERFVFPGEHALGQQRCLLSAPAYRTFSAGCSWEAWLLYARVSLGGRKACALVMAICCALHTFRVRRPPWQPTA